MKILSFGCDVNLLQPEDPTNESQYRQQRYCDLLDQDKTFIVLTASSPYSERRFGRIRAVSAQARSGWLRIGKAYALGLKLGTRLRPQLVEYQDARIEGLAVYAVARTLHIPLVGGVFNDLFDNPTWIESYRRRVSNRIGKFVLAHSKYVRCDSLDTALTLQHKGYPHVRYIPFYVPWLDKFTIPDEARDDRMKQWNDDPVILSVARLSEEKNISMLLHAFAQAYASTSRGKLIIVGDGPLKSDLEQMATQLGINARTTWAGFVEIDVLLRLFREANLFVLSSDSETSARVLIQAQTARLPTVTTDTSGSRSIVNDNETGYITPVRDVTAMTKRLTCLLGERSSYQRMLYSAAYHARHDHGEQVIVTQLKAFYEDALPAARALHEERS